MNLLAQFRVIFLIILFTVTLCVGCSSSPSAIITAEDADIERLDELFTEFTTTYQFSQPVERHTVLGTLKEFAIDEFDEPIPLMLAQSNSSWLIPDIPEVGRRLDPKIPEAARRSIMVEATRRFITEWHELLGLDLTTLSDQVEVTVSHNEITSNRVGWYYIKFRQVIDNYLPPSGNRYGIQCHLSDDGFLWNLNAWVVPNIDLPRVADPPSSKTQKKMYESLIGETLTPGGHCGELQVTYSSEMLFRETELKIQWDTNKIDLHVAYSFTVEKCDGLNNDPPHWIAYFNAATGEYLSANYGFPCR